MAYLPEWLEGYQGNGRRGFRENTRDEYRRLLDLYALRFFGDRLRLGEVTPRHLAQYVAWLADEDKQGGGGGRGGPGRGGAGRAGSPTRRSATRSRRSARRWPPRCGRA